MYSKCKNVTSKIVLLFLFTFVYFSCPWLQKFSKIYITCQFKMQCIVHVTFPELSSLISTWCEIKLSFVMNFRQGGGGAHIEATNWKLNTFKSETLFLLCMRLILTKRGLLWQSPLIYVKRRKCFYYTVLQLVLTSNIFNTYDIRLLIFVLVSLCSRYNKRFYSNLLKPF